MPVELKELNDGTLLEIHLSGTLVKKDYEAFVPAVERLVKQHGTIDMLVAMHGFHGETAGALWEDTKFAFWHFRDIERLGRDGKKAWRRSASRSRWPRSATSSPPKRTRRGTG